MEILSYTLKWSEAILRWGHVLFAILWVGNSFLFNYLDNKLNKTNTTSVPATSGTPARAVNPNNKDWTKMNKAERQKNWADIVKGYAMNNK